MLRIVSLLPSLTEIVGALGRADALVGRSHECDYPSGVEALPICTEPKLDPSGSSREIDDAVNAIVRDGLSVYRVLDTLRDLAPDVILTQDQCEVCAVSLSDVEQAVADWTGGKRPRVVSVAPSTLSEVWASITQVAEAIDAADAGRDLVARLTDRVSELGERTGALPRPRVACIEWIEPLMCAGNWMPELVALAGGHNLFGTTGEHSPWTEWPALREADPEAIFVLPCGFDMARTRAEMHVLEALPGYADVRAVREGRVFVTDGNQYFNRPGPRLMESIEILAEALHPELGPFGHEGRGFQRVSPS